MRIVHIALQHAPRDNRIYHKECISLARRYDAHLLAPATDSSDGDPVTFHVSAAYPDHSRAIFGWLADYCRSFVRNFRKALRVRGELYHIHETPLIPLGALLKLSGKRVIYDAHEDAPRQAVSIGRSMGRPRLGRAYAGVCRVYEAVARWLFDGFVAATPEIGRRFPSERTAVVQNFPLPQEIDAMGQRLRSRPYDERPMNVAYLGGLTRIRGIREIIEAVDTASVNSKVRLQLAGRFDSDSFSEECRALAGWQYVDYRGELERQDVLNLLSEVRIGLVTMHPVSNYMDSWPVKLFEYMAAGLPVIASDFSEWRQRFGRFECMRFVDPLDSRAIGREIEDLLRHHQDAAAMGKRGRAAVQHYFNWSTEVEKLFQLYDRIHEASRKDR